MGAGPFAIKGPESLHQRIRRVLPQAIRFVGSGLVVFPVGLGVSALCHEVFGWRAEISTAVAIFVLLLINFVVGRLFVFRSSGSVRRQFTRFAGIALAMRGAEYLAFLALFRVVGIPYLLSMLSALIMSSSIKFFVYRMWVFAHVSPHGKRGNP